MKISVKKEILKIIPDLCIGVVVARNVDNTNENKNVDELLIKSIKSEKEKLKTTTIKEIPEIQLYNFLMQKVGINSSKYKCSLQALLERINKEQTLPLTTNGIVNLCNYISIKYRVSIGVQSIDKLEENIELRFANEIDCSNAKNDMGNDKLIEGEIIYATEKRVLTRRWMWRTTKDGRVDNKTRNFVFLIDGINSNQEKISNACEELAFLLEKYYKSLAIRDFLCSTRESIELDSINDQEIDNIIKIMLKGVDSHTDTFFIKEKIKRAYEENRPLRIKLGLDPSAPDIHLGHSVVLRKIRQLQELGHQAIIIIGDYTGRIGDPTGKSKTRKQLSIEEVNENALTYQKQIFKILDPLKTIVKYNSEWFEKMNFQDVISLSSKCTVARMMERDDFSNRYNNHLPLSVHEFFYPLMQAYDSVAVEADIELGGTDQTFNVLMGRNIQKSYGQEPQITLFMPLLEGIDGVEKMSKSLGNYIGINEKPFEIFEKVMRIKDDMIIKYYNLCTDVHPDKIETIFKSMQDGANPRDVKMQLAYEITKLYSSEEEASCAREKYIGIYQKKEIPDDIKVLECQKNCESIDFAIVNILMSTGDYSSKSEIRRILQQGGIKWNNQPIDNFKNLVIQDENIINVGKRHIYKMVFK